MFDVDIGAALLAVLVMWFAGLFVPGIVPFGYALTHRRWWVSIAGLVMPGLVGGVVSVLVWGVFQVVPPEAERVLSNLLAVRAGGVYYPLILMLPIIASLGVATWLTWIIRRRVRSLP